MSKSKKFTSYSVGEKGLNRVRVFQDRNGYLLAEWWVPSSEGGTKRQRLSLGCDCPKEARAKALLLSTALAQARLKGEDAAEGGPERRKAGTGVPRLTVAELFDIYLAERTPLKAETSQRYDRQCLGMWKAFLGANRTASSVGRTDWYAFGKAREEERIFPGEASRGRPGRRTIRRDLQLLRAVYNWAVDPDSDRLPLLDENPVDGLALPKESRPNRVLATQRQTTLLLGVASEVDWRFRVALVLAHETGHRIGSIRHLRWEDVDFVARQLEWQEATDKEGNPHRSPMSEDAYVALREATAHVPEDGEWVLPGPKDPSRPVRKDTLTGWLKEAERLAGLKHVKGFGWHSWRRKLANDLREKASPTQIAALGGWNSVATVVTVYMQPDGDQLREIQRLKPGLGLAAGDREAGPGPEPSERGGRGHLRVIDGGRSGADTRSSTDSTTDSTRVSGA